MNDIKIGHFKPMEVDFPEKPARTEDSIKMKALTKNLRTLSKFMDRTGKIDPSRFRIVEKQKDGISFKILEVNSRPQQLFNKSKKHTQDINRFIESIVSDVSEITRQSMTSSLATSAAQYNKIISTASPSHSRKPGAIQLNQIINENVPEIAVKKFVSSEKRKPMVAARKDEPQIIKQKRVLFEKNIRAYRGDPIDHGKEAKNILKDTQWQNIKDSFYRFLKGLGIRHKRLIKHDYYHGIDEQKYDKMIYSKDKPILLNKPQEIDSEGNLPAPTSYWLGHATMLFNISARSENDATKMTSLRVITDPVEGDLAPFLYERKTKFGKPMEKLPPPDVYLLSHNHLDHYSDKTIDKLLQYQPVMVVPKGDEKRFKAKGFKNVQELDWWESTQLKFKQGNDLYSMEIHAVPSRHWAGQGPCGGHESTFLGYVIKHETGDVYFAGDTARLYKGPKIEISNVEKKFRSDLLKLNIPELSEQLIDYEAKVAKARKLIKRQEEVIQKTYKKMPVPKDVADALTALKTAREETLQRLRTVRHVLELVRLHDDLMKAHDEKFQAAVHCADIGEANLLKKQAEFLGGQAASAMNFALTGETSELSHVDALKDLFNIKYNYQPGGPDEKRDDMESTHQASVDSMWMHDQIMLQRFYKRGMNKFEFLAQASEVKTMLMHTMTYKLGNLKLFDTAESLSNVLYFLKNENFDEKKEALENELNKLAEKKYPIRNTAKPKDVKRIEEKRRLYKLKMQDETLRNLFNLKRYEWLVISELIQTTESMLFEDGDKLTPKELADLLKETIIIQRIGSLFDLGEGKEAQKNKCVF